MKKALIITGIFLITIKSFSQSQEAEQLLLNWEKLIQFRNILDEMYTGYQTLYKGYTAIKDISQGNFDLHKTFLDGLLEVSPAIRQYSRIADIVKYQLRIARKAKMSFNEFKDDQNFSVREIGYLSKVYKNLLDQSLKSLDELLLIITAGKLRMSDDERLSAIDNIYKDITSQFSFLLEFTNSTAVLAFQRDKESKDIEISRGLHNIR